MGEHTEDVSAKIASDCIPLDMTCSEYVLTEESGMQSGVIPVDNLEQSSACDELHYNLRNLPTCMSQRLYLRDIHCLLIMCSS